MEGRRLRRYADAMKHSYVIAILFILGAPQPPACATSGSIARRVVRRHTPRSLTLPHRAPALTFRLPATSGLQTLQAGEPAALLPTPATPIVVGTPVQPTAMAPTFVGGGIGWNETKALAVDETTGAASGDYADLMTRPPYIGTAEHPCRWAALLGPCTYEGGKRLPPPPGPPGSFQPIPYALAPRAPYQLGHIMIGLAGNAKWSLHFKTPSKPAQIAFNTESPMGGLAAPLEFFLSISEKPGDFDVPLGCLRTPDMLATTWAGGAPNSAVGIIVDIGGIGISRGCILRTDTDYYLNIAGVDGGCSEYWNAAPSRAGHPWPGFDKGCPLVLTGPGLQALTPGGWDEYCLGVGQRYEAHPSDEWGPRCMP